VRGAGFQACAQARASRNDDGEAVGWAKPTGRANARRDERARHRAEIENGGPGASARLCPSDAAKFMTLEFRPRKTASNSSGRSVIIISRSLRMIVVSTVICAAQNRTIGASEITLQPDMLGHAKNRRD